MSERAAMRLRRAAILLGVGGAALGLAAPAHAVPVPDYEMPFACGQVWEGSTRPSHSPSAYSVDFNRVPDTGEPALAAAAGVVTRVEDLGRRSYGKYVVVDHGDGDSTLYAHLDALWSVVGQRVDQGAVLGLVGGTGGVSGPHLHFEEKLNNKVVAPFFHQAEFVMPASQRSRNCPDSPVVGDWDGDGIDEVAVFRRAVSAKFRLAQDGAAPAVVGWGLSTDQPVVGDWDGNGVADVGIRRQKGNRFWLRHADGTSTVIRFGARPDSPVTGDWDGNGITDLGLWRPQKAKFIQRFADGSKARVAVGAVGQLPLTGDWDGDGRTDLGAFDPATASFTLRTVGADGVPVLTTIPFGLPTDLPVTGDWDGDGRSDLGIWRPSTGSYELRVSPPAARGTVTVTSVKFGRKR
ncbi:MAG: VCBS repeat domain-containing M23 family metallopeptidase [Nocardioides sp.]